MTEPPSISPIELEIRTAADPAAVWRTITDPGRIALWFTDASPLGPVGAPYRLDFGDGSVVVGEVLAVEPGRRFAHSWAWEGAEPGARTTVEWTVGPLADGGTLVRLIHGGWDAVDGGGAARDDHEGYWTGYLDDLRDVLDEG